jgi:gamma-glutamyl-gamma-aminobutyrate hydrolase PuuD
MDELPEAIELDGAQTNGQPNGWLLGVQWHPEADESSTVVEALVQAAANGKA